MKKFLSILLSFVLIGSILFSAGIPAYAKMKTHGKCGKNVTYSFQQSTGTLTISGKGKMYDYDAPDEAYTPFENMKGIKKIIIKKGVTSIGGAAFGGSDSLTTVEMSDSVKTINAGAFYDCKNLKSVKLSKNLKSIGWWGFFNCESLESIKLPKSLKTIENSAFYNCNLRKIVIPENVKTLDAAFHDCKKLSSVEIKGVVADMPWTAFDGTAYFKNAKNWTACNGVKKGVLYNGKNLLKVSKKVKGKVKVKKNIRAIAGGAFYGCKKITEINLPKSLTIIGSEAFYNCKALKKINIPKNVKYINSVTFKNCKSLTSIKLPSKVKTIGDEAFKNCRSLTSIKLPSKVKAIGNEAFKNCASLKSVSFPLELKTIRDSAFENCTLLKKVKFNNNLKKIGDEAFYKCSALQNISIPRGVKSIGDYCFNKCEKLKNIRVAKKNKYFSSKNGVLYNKKKTVLYLFPVNNGIKSFTIPNTVKAIGDNAFEGCKSLESITIPNKVKTIGEYAFCNCKSLKCIKISNKLKVIGDYAFDGCRSLNNISIPRSVKSIGDYAFFDTGYENNEKNWTENGDVRALYLDNCLLSVDWDTSSDKFKIDNDTIVIANNAFMHCDFKTLDLRSKITDLDLGLFYSNDVSVYKVYIPSSVKRIYNQNNVDFESIHIYYDGKVSQWAGLKKLDLGECEKCTVHCSDATFTIPEGTDITNNESGKNYIKLTWEKVKYADGYQIQYTPTKKFAQGKTLYVKNAKTTSKTIKKLKKNTKYRIRIRSYKKINKTKIYSDWSFTEKVKTKK